MGKAGKILLVGHGLGLGGADRYLFEQATLLKCRYHVDCVAFEGGPLEILYKQENISFSVHAISKLDDAQIFKLVSDYDFIIVNTMYAIFFAFESQKYKPTILILHDCMTYMKNIILRTSCTSKELHQIKHLYGVSEYQVETLNKIGLNDVHTLNNFVADIYSPAQLKKYNSKVKFLTVANWNPVKGYDLALNAFQSLSPDEKKRIEWHIVGEMDTGKECRKFCRIAEAEEWVIFHGAITDKRHLYRLYQESDVYLHMSREDSNPLSVVDAAMMRTPLIVSKDTGAKYLAKKGAGWIVDEHDCENATAMIRKAINSYNDLINIGERARANYLAKATPEAYMRTLTKEINRIIKENISESIYRNQQTRQSTVKQTDPKLRIALYGYNMYAQIEDFYYRKYHIYKLAGIYDQAYDRYRGQGLDIKNPEELRNDEFEFVCICCVFPSTIQSIKKYLIGLGISSEKICVGINSVLERAGAKK